MPKEKLIDFDCYELYKDGRIYSKYWKKNIDINNKTNSGYVKVTLKTKDKKYHTYSLHRVIWYFFNGEIPEGYEVGHKDSKTENNSLENLYLCNHKENMNNPITKNRISIAQKNTDLLNKKSKQVYQYTLDNKLIAIYPSTKETERETGFYQMNISKCCNGKIKSYKGYRWSYKPL